ncbi:MAG: PAS domain S-box protein [Candidatus Nanopelagicales bacterium]
MSGRVSEAGAARVERGQGDPRDVDRLRWLLESTGDAFFVLRTRPDVAMEYITPTIADLVGYTPAEHYADPGLVLRVLDEDYREAAAQVMGGEPGTEFELELCWHHRDGRVVWSLHRGVVREREDGSVVVEGSGRDITALHLARTELERAESLFRMLAENASDVVYLLAPDGLVEWISPSVDRVLGWSREEITGRRPWELLHPDDVDRATASMAQALSDAGGDSLEVRIRHRDGTYRWMAAASSRADVSGAVPRLVVTMRDVHEGVEARRSLAESEARYRFLVEEGRDAVAIYDPDWSVRWVSAAVDRLFGLEPGDLASDLRPELHPDDIGRMTEMRRAIDRGDPGVRIRARLRAPGGDWLWTESVARPVRQPDGSLSAIHVVTRDVHEQVLAEMRLAESEQRFRLAMLEAPHGMAILDLDGRFVEVNPALCRTLGHEEHWLLAHGIDDVLHPEEVDAEREARAALSTGTRDHITVERRFLRRGGSVIWGQHALGVLRGEDGRPMSYVSQVQDVTRIRRAMAALEYQASHDPLTGLLNRSELTERLEERLARSGETDTPLAVLFCDVDRLKSTNDGLGHAAGDALLRAVASRLSASVRGSDLVARVGGDEFVVLLDDVAGADEAEAIAEQVRRTVSRPVAFDGRSLEPTLSIGVLVARTGDDVDVVLRRADEALYAAKAAGRDQVAVAPVEPDA